MSASRPTLDFIALQMRLKGLRAKRRLGQHFLNDADVLERIASATQAGSQTLIVEIGPGPGALTTGLAARAGAVVAVELDRSLSALHEDAFSGCPQVEFVYADALRVDLIALARQSVERCRAEGADLTECVLAGNLPFQITSPFLFRQCTSEVPWRRMVLMVQREVADRVCSEPGRRACGVLTVKLAYWWRVVERFEVAARYFSPRPDVDAAVLVFEPTPDDVRPNPSEWKRLSVFVDAAFSQRRKMLVNTLAARWAPAPDKDVMRAALEAMALRPDVRAENLSPDQMRTLCARLSEDAGE